MSAIGTHAESGKRIVAAHCASAVHYLETGAPGPWGGRPVPRIACGRAVPYDPERWSEHTRNVTCDRCRMSLSFQRARGG